MTNSIKRIIVALSALITTPIFADTVVVTWTEVTHRTNETLAGEVLYEVWYNNELVSEQVETEFSIELSQGAHTVQVFAVEDGMRSTPYTLTYDIKRFPPKAPGPR